MTQAKEMQITVKRINHNRYVVNNKHYDYLQLVNWFQHIITK